MQRLTSFGASVKRAHGCRGFRGVGRLAGIGYCQELTFRARSQDDCSVNELRWDCKKLKNLLRAHDSDRDLNDVVKETVAVRQIGAAGFQSTSSKWNFAG